jgi:hypothetical protein
LGALENLVQLDLACCPKITDLSALHRLPNLKHLYIDGCTGLDRDEIDIFKELQPDCNVHDT